MFANRTEHFGHRGASPEHFGHREPIGGLLGSLRLRAAPAALLHEPLGAGLLR